MAFEEEDDKQTIDMDKAVEEISSGLGLGIEQKEEKEPEKKVEEIIKDDTNKEEKPKEDKKEEDPPKVEDKDKKQEENPSPDPPPKTWRQEASNLWGKLPKEVQAEIIKRENDFHKGIEVYKSSAQIGENLKQVLHPYLQDIRKDGHDPMNLISELVKSHYVLTKASQEHKQIIFNKLAEIYGVLAPGQEAPYTDPQISTLKKTVDELRSQLDTHNQRVANSAQADIRAKVDAFSKDPKNLYFEELATDIARLINTKAANTLEEAYEMALWSNPTVRAKELSRQTAEKEAKLKEENEAKVNKAKQASAANVSSTSKKGSETTKLGTMDDTMRETLKEIKSRT